MQSGLMAGGVLLSPSLIRAAARGRAGSYKIGLQLYTVREAMAKDPVDTLAQVASIGYQEMESATYSGTEKFYGMDGAAFAKVLKQHGLTIPSGHYSIGDPQTKGTILSDWDRAVEDAAHLGMKYMVCAYLPEDKRKTLDDYKRVIEALNKAGETCRKSGIQFCYHNHNFEFPKIDGQIPYELMLKQADKDLVKMEMDIYWITRAGYDPVAMFSEHPGRFVLWHVKDMDNTAKQAFTEVGNGVIDWDRIFSHAKESGMQHFFVEQDKCPGSPFVSIKESYTYLKQQIVPKFHPA
jgi:sugar phosphate isomerase/epimerase